MPPKRNCAKNMLAKEKKLMESRLQQISLRLEDYVYSNMPISVADAQAHLDEIAVYKMQCGRDEHSLQVIEKLTRCMRGIIIEQRESHGYDVTNNGYAGTHTDCPSPVYSLPDEDKTMFNENSNVTDKLANVNDFEATKKITIETIDLTTDDEDDKPGIILVTNVEVSRAMSSLSIRYDEHSLNDMVCSQSILDNFKHNTINVVENTEDIKRVQSLVIDNELRNSKLQPVKQSVLRNIRKSDIGKEKALEIQPVETETNTQHFISNIRTDTLDGRAPEPNNQYKAVIGKRKIVKPQCCTQDLTACVKKVRTRQKKTKDNTQNKENKPIKQRKDKRKNKNQITTESEQVRTPAVTKETDIETNLPVFKINVNLSNTTEIASENNTKSIKPDILQTSPKLIPIYNKNTENDLSWVENIRFVREVTSEEYDSALADVRNKFWDDFTLPNDWNDQDFA